MELSDKEKCLIPFGKSTKHILFNLDPEVKFTNHGSYGSAPKYIYERKKELQNEMKNCPDRWFRFTAFRKWEESIKSLADYLKVPKDNLLLFENTTESIGTILKWIEFDGCKDAILTASTNHLAVLNGVDFAMKYRMQPNNYVNVFKIEIKFPIKSVNDVISEYEKACHEIIQIKKLRLRFAVIDHIASLLAIQFPIEQISKLIRTQAGPDCIILIDGAHGLGQIPLDFSAQKFHADFYVSSLHKWFLAPPSCAFMYTSNQDYLDFRFQPCYASLGYSTTVFNSNHSVSYNHFQRGTMDKTSQYIVPECINFYENILGGLDRIQEYVRPLLERAVEMLEREWGTKRLEVPEEMLSPFIRVIKLPDLPGFSLSSVDEHDWEKKVTLALNKHILEKYNVVAFIRIIGKEIVCRISCFVTNEFSDYVALKDAVLKIKNGE